MPPLLHTYSECPWQFTGIQLLLSNYSDNVIRRHWRLEVEMNGERELVSGHQLGEIGPAFFGGLVPKPFLCSYQSKVIILQ